MTRRSLPSRTGKRRPKAPRKPTIIALSLLFVIPVAFTEARAVGLGFYGTAQGGTGNWDVEDLGFADPNGFLFDDVRADGDSRRLGFGFVLDTAPAQDEVFAYRLEIGAEFIRSDWETLKIDSARTRPDDTVKLGGLASTHTFGFGVLRLPMVRVWLGPRIRFGFYGGEIEGGDLDRTTNHSMDIALFELGAGPALGANLNFGRIVTLGVSTGFMLSGYAGVIDGVDDSDITGYTRSVFASGVLMLRMGADADRNLPSRRR